MPRLDKEDLTKIRRDMGYYSISEIGAMFECGRPYIDNLLNTGQISYISPNGRSRFIKLDEYLEFIKNQKGGENGKS